MRKECVLVALLLPCLWQSIVGQVPIVGENPAKKQPINSSRRPDERGTKESPLVVDTTGHQQTPSERQEAQKRVAEAQAEEQYRRSVDNWMLRWTGVTAAATGFLVLVGLGGVIAAIRTLRAVENQALIMQQQLIDAREANSSATTFARGNLASIEAQAALMAQQLAEMKSSSAHAADLAQQATVQSSAMILQAKALEKQAAAMIAAERAWILVDIAKLPDFKPNPDTLEILWIFPTIKNYGKTTGRLTRVRGIVKLIAAGESLPVEPEYVPGQGFDEQVNVALPPEVPMQPRLAIDGQEFSRVLNRDVTMYIHGSVEYDIFPAENRSSAYCFTYVVQGGYSPHPSGFYPTLEAPRAYTECT